MTKPADKFEGLRVYVVVPGTVQTPVKVTYNPRRKGDIYSFGRFKNTRDIVQPAGRQAMQVGHVRGMVEHELVIRDVEHEFRRGLKGKMFRSANLRRVAPYHPITGIVKACRDSFELLHVKSLLQKAGIGFFEFEDTQEDLYEDVVTALATEPVTPFAVAGILDYLPLWTGK
jgi:hypothetical protein